MYPSEMSSDIGDGTMTNDFSEKFTDTPFMATDILETLLNHMEIRIIGHGTRSPMDTKLSNYLFTNFLMFYFHKGRAKISHGEQTSDIAPGSFYIYNPFEIYDARLLTNPPYEFSYVYFSITPYSAMLDFKRNALLSDDTIFQKKWYSFAGSAMSEFCSPEAEGKAGQGAVLQQGVKSILTYILYDRLNNYSNENNFIGAKEATLIDNTFAYVEKHLDEPIDIGHLVKAIGTSRTTIDRVFRDTAFVSPIKAITRFKMQKSLQLMGNGASIKETAQALGYSSSFHFSNVFMSVLGKRPSKYISLFNQKQIVCKK
jgi:AraC-like DNA-binding protein